MVEPLLLAIFATAYLGFALLAISQKRHWAAVAGTTPPRRAGVIGLRAGGGGMLLLSLALALARDGPSFGSLLWATAISLVALGVAFTLAWCPRMLRPLAFVGRGGCAAYGASIFGNDGKDP